MVIYADEVPDAWIGQRFEVKNIQGVPHRFTITGIHNDNWLLAHNGDGKTVPYFSVAGFAKSLLLGIIRRVDEERRTQRNVDSTNDRKAAEDKRNSGSS